MPSRSKVRRQHAFAACELKKRYRSLLEAGKVARRSRERGTNLGERNQVPYLCPNGCDHYHTGRNVLGKRRIQYIEWRLSFHKLVSAEEMEYAGLEVSEEKKEVSKEAVD